MKTRKIKLPCHGIVVTLTGTDRHRSGRTLPLGGSITSKLKETCPDCGDPECERHCEPQAERQDSEREAAKEERLLHNARVDALESMILACAVAGIDIESPAFVEAVETVLDKIGNEG